MAPLGSIAKRVIGRDAIERARARASLVPDLLVEAKRVANTTHSGWHGRRKRGVGENFWQFRPYLPGETMSRIDWRRSARDDTNIYVQDKEWQATHTVWLWVDESDSMLFKSEMASVSKQSRALVLAFALAELLARGGERIGWPGVSDPVLSRNAVEMLAEALLQKPPQTNIPKNFDFGNYSDLILISDFLDPVEDVHKMLRGVFKKGTCGHIVQIVDPAEESFPYQGRIEFADPETGEKFIAGNAQTLKSAYTAELANRIADIREITRSLGWSYIKHHTNTPASQVLASLHAQMGERR